MIAADANTPTDSANLRIKLSEALAVCGLLFYTIACIVFLYCPILETFPAISALNPFSFCSAASMALAITSIALGPRALSKAQLLIVILSMAIFLFSGSKTGDYRLAHTCIQLIAIAGIDLTRISTAYYRTVLVAILVIVLLSITGLLYNRDTIPNNRLVFSFGFVHPNTLGALLFSALAAMTYACWHSKTWPVPVALSAIAALFSYCLLSSRASAIILVLLTLCGLAGHIPFLQKNPHAPKRLFLVVLVMVPAIMLAIIVLSSMSFDSSNSLFSMLDKMTNGRLHYGHQYYAANGGFTLVGRELHYVSSYHNCLSFTNIDSGFCYLLFVNGLLSLLALAAIYIAAVIKLARKRPEFIIMAIMLIAAVHLMVESYMLFPASSFAILFLAEAFATEDEQQTTLTSKKD